jgi:putative heme-binding domain-containing protein
MLKSQKRARIMKFCPVMVAAVCLLVLVLGAVRPGAAAAAGEDGAAAAAPSAVASIMRLLQSGRVPESRLGPIVEQIGRRGNAGDLRFLYEQAIRSDGYAPAVRQQVFDLLVDAALARKVVPTGDLSGIARLLEGPEVVPELQRPAVTLAGLWKVAGAVDPLARLVTQPHTTPSLRGAALQALTLLDKESARNVAVRLCGPDQSIDTRLQGLAALSRFDLEAAARLAGEVLATFPLEADAAPLLDAFLARRGGTAALAVALEQTPASRDVARRLLRELYAAGRSDAELSTVLGRLAEIETNPQPLSPDDVADVVARTTQSGEAARGEEVFRRADLSCMKCHALSQAGGQIGPDLSALGASSPVDYIVNSISDPDQQIKEAFLTRVVVTTDGLVHQGIVVDRTADRLILKDANSQLVEVPLADIEEDVEGKSLMPKGLIRFMTDQELLDLVKFLSMLGKPGTEYAIRTTQRMQRWRVLTDVPQSLQSAEPDDAALEDLLAGAPLAQPAYARVNGDLPLDELARRVKQPVLYLLGEVNVTQPGPIELRVDSDEGLQGWIGPQTLFTSGATADLPRGRHTIVLRVDTRERSRGVLKLELDRASGSRAEFAVVDGA